VSLELLVLAYNAMPMNLNCFILTVAICLCAATPAPAEDILQTTFAQRMAHITAGRDGSILVLDLATGKRIAAVNAGCLYRSPRPIGSLIKPFTALAFLGEGEQSPHISCPPTMPGASGIDDCWYHPGHGMLGLKEALALSCNHFFYRLASSIPWDRFRNTLRALNLSDGSESIIAATADEVARLECMMGRNGRIRIRPINLALAYASLFNGGKLYAVTAEGNEPEFLGTPLVGWNTTPILEGMLASAEHGTGRLAAVKSHRLYTKTGTTVSNLNPPKSGAYTINLTEGWCVAIAMDLQTPFLVMTRINPGKGASDAASLAGEAIRTYLQLTGEETGKPGKTVDLSPR
jgi:cell division protein FtsI/penicillin-binding protein 2